MASKLFTAFSRTPDHISRRFFRRRTKGSKVEVPVPQWATNRDPSSASSPTASTLPTEATQNEPQCFHSPAQRLQQHFPPSLNWLGSGDVQILDTTAVSSGSFSEVWRGLLQGQLVAVKSFRCYSSPEFNSAEVEVVSCPQPARLENN